MNHIAQVFQDQFLSPTLQELLDKIQYHTFRAYSYDTSTRDQDKIISKLKERGLTVRVISNFEDIKKWSSFDVDVLIIKDTGAIINNLDNLKPFENLLTSDTKFIIFFNAGIDVQIDSREKRDRWKALADNSKYCYEISFKEKILPPPKSGISKDTLTRKAVVIGKTPKYLRQTIRNLFYPPWTPGKITFLFLIFLLPLAGLLTLTLKWKFLPLVGTSIIVAPLVRFLLLYIVDEIPKMKKREWFRIVIFFMALVNLAFGYSVIDLAKVVYKGLKSLLGI